MLASVAPPCLCCWTSTGEGKPSTRFPRFSKSWELCKLCIRWNRICNIYRIHIIDSCDVMPVEPVPKALLHPGSEIWIGGRNRTGFPKVTSLFRSQLARVLVPNCSGAIYLVSHKTKSCTDLALSMHQPNNQLWPTSFKNSAALVPLLKQLCFSLRTVDKAPSKPRPWYDWMICWDTVRRLTRDIDIFKN